MKVEEIARPKRKEVSDDDDDDLKTKPHSEATNKTTAHKQDFLSSDIM